MKPSRVFVGVLLGCMILPASVRAETVADRKGAVLKDRATMENDPRWIYNDYERGFAEGKRTGKPVLIVLRCIPCLACAGIDARLLVENTELTPLLDRFVCVRVINANALDLSRFQFDFDLSFTTMIFNGDGTVYGRYGSWAHQKDPKESATDGFRRTLEAALELHRGYPGNKAALQAKQGKPSPYRTPVEMPTIQGKYLPTLDWENKVVASCVHCHQIGDALRTAHRNKKESIPPTLVYPFPQAETIGLDLALNHAARVNRVAEGSIAEAAGFRPGDEVVSFGGQPVISSADLSWALHTAGESGEVKVSVRRADGKPANLTVALPAGWRYRADISRRVGTWGMRAMALGGLLLEDLPDTERERRGLRKDQLALFAKHVGEYNEHAAAKKAGFVKEDVIVEIAGSSARETESQLIGRLLRDYKPGEKVKATVLRGDQRFEFQIPMQ